MVKKKLLFNWNQHFQKVPLWKHVSINWLLSWHLSFWEGNKKEKKDIQPYLPQNFPPHFILPFKQISFHYLCCFRTITKCFMEHILNFDLLLYCPFPVMPSPSLLTYPFIPSLSSRSFLSMLMNIWWQYLWRGSERYPAWDPSRGASDFNEQSVAYISVMSGYELNVRRK